MSERPVFASYQRVHHAALIGFLPDLEIFIYVSQRMGFGLNVRGLCRSSRAVEMIIELQSRSLTQAVTAFLIAEIAQQHPDQPIFENSSNNWPNQASRDFQCTQGKASLKKLLIGFAAAVCIDVNLLLPERQEEELPVRQRPPPL